MFRVNFLNISRKFIGRTGIVFGGTVGGQVIAFIGLPFLAKIFNAEILGQTATVLAYVNILSMISCLQYDQAVIIAKDDEVPSLLTLGAITTFLFTTFLFILSFSPLKSLIFIQNLNFDLSLPVLLFFYSLFLLFINYRLRENELFKVSAGRTIYYGGSVLFQIIAGLLFGGSSEVFLLAQSLAAFIAVLILFPFAKFSSWARKPSAKPLAQKIVSIARLYSNFPKYQMGAGLVNTISAQLPVILLRVFFSEEWAGWYFMAWRILAAPVTLISQAVGQVFYRDSAERERSGEDNCKLVENVALSLTRISFFPSIAFGILAPFLVTVFLGNEWLPVSNIMQVLLISLVVTFFVSPLSSLLNVKGKQFGSLYLNLLLFGLKFIGLFIGIVFGSAFTSITLFSLGTVVGMLIFFDYVMKSVGSSFLRFIGLAKPMFVDGFLLMAIVSSLIIFNVLYTPLALFLVATIMVFAIHREYKRFINSSNISHV